MTLPTSELTSEIPACDLTVFGGTGDLALRKLLPALYQSERRGDLPPGSRIVGASRSDLDDDSYRALVRAALDEHVADPSHGPSDGPDGEVVDRLLARVHHLTLDAEQPDGWHVLHGLLKDEQGLAGGLTGGMPRVRAFYLAVAPRLFGPICDHLERIGVVDDDARVVLEKPIGSDLASARQVNDAVGRVFAEHQIFRIDHYLGKESVQNLLVTRFANTFLEPLWNSHWIDHVQITVAETLGVGERGEYYDTAGALRDMVQNHLLQLLCLVAMEPPTYVGRETVRDEKLKVLQALKPLSSADVDRDVVRGVYSHGVVDGQVVPAYADDLAADGIDDPHRSSADGRDHGPSRTETFVALRAEVQNWRWARVPFYLRTGKRMDRRVSEIVVVFKRPPHIMFPGVEHATEPNKLYIRVQPDEGMQLQLTVKEPGPGGVKLRPVTLDLNYATAFPGQAPDAYERLIMDVLRGNPTLFMRRDEVEEAWTWVEPILARWAELDESAAATSTHRPKRYPAGTSGPFAAAALLERDGRTWQETEA